MTITHVLSEKLLMREITEVSGSVKRMKTNIIAIFQNEKGILKLCVC